LRNFKEHFKNILEAEILKRINLFVLTLQLDAFNSTVKILPFCKRRKKQQKQNYRMFNADNISTRSYVSHIRLYCLQAGSKITIPETPNACNLYPNTLQNGNVKRCNVRIFARIFSA